MHSSSEAIYFDKVVSEIDSTKGNKEALRHLVTHLREGFLKVNVCLIDGNARASIGVGEEASEKKLFYNNFMLEPEHEYQHKFNLEVFGNGDTKYQMMIMGRNGHGKYCCMHCRRKKSDWSLCHNENEVTETCSTEFPL